MAKRSTATEVADMMKACSRCGKVHPANYKCSAGRSERKKYEGGEERKLRGTNRWRLKSEEVRTKADYMCEVCKAEGRFNAKGLEVHHIVKLKNDADGLLDNSNLICLCQYHHKLADDGELDPDRLRELARKREEQYS